MKTKFEDWDESFLDLEDYQVERALTNAALDAIHRARRFGTDIVTEKDGKVVSLKPNETGPYEAGLLENLARLNRKISEIQGQHSESASTNEGTRPNLASGFENFCVMNAHRLKAVITEEGRLELNSIPFHPGESVEVLIARQSDGGILPVRAPARGRPYSYLNSAKSVASEDCGASH